MNVIIQKYLNYNYEKYENTRASSESIGTAKKVPNEIPMIIKTNKSLYNCAAWKKETALAITNNNKPTSMLN